KAARDVDDDKAGYKAQRHLHAVVRFANVERHVGADYRGDDATADYGKQGCRMVVVVSSGKHSDSDCRHEPTHVKDVLLQPGEHSDCSICSLINTPRPRMRQSSV